MRAACAASILATAVAACCCLAPARIHASPFTPLAWQQVVQSGPLAGQAKLTAWINDANQNFIADAIDALPDTAVVDVLIDLNQCVPSSQIQQAFSSFGANLQVGKFVSFVSLDAVSRADIEAIASRPDVAMVELRTPLDPFLSVNPRVIRSWDVNLPRPPAPPPNGLGITGAGVNIAILDGGVDESHDAFQGKFVAGYDAINGVETNPADDLPPSRWGGHGTSVASVALGKEWSLVFSDPELPVRFRGVAPDAGLVDIKIAGLDPTTNAETTNSQAGLDKAIQMQAEWGIGVINLASGGHGSSDGKSVLDQLIDAAVARGIVVVAAAGNDGPGNIGIPAGPAASGAITVAASDIQASPARQDDTLYASSNRGPRADDNDGDPLDELKPDVAAPGTASAATRTPPTNNVLLRIDGTSMAAPHVAGVAALILEARPGMNPGSVKQLLKQTAEGAPSIPGMETNNTQDSADDPSYDVGSGSGLIDALAAVGAAAVTEVGFPSCIGGTVPPSPSCRLSTNNQNPPHWLNRSDIRLQAEPVVEGQANEIRVDVRNGGASDARGVIVTVGVYDLSAGIKQFHELGSHVLDIPKNATVTIPQNWIPEPGHRCIQVSIDYGLDVSFDNNVTQRNVDVRSTSSPAVFVFDVENPLTDDVLVELETFADRPGWTCRLDQERFVLDPFAACPVPVTATLEPTPGVVASDPPAQAERILLGGVSLQAVDETAGTATCHVYAFGTDVSDFLPVPVDIKPRSCPNPLAVKRRGVVPVAIVGTADFDVTQIDPGSVRLEGVLPTRSALEDVTSAPDLAVGKEDCFLDCLQAASDGYMDLTLIFERAMLVAALGEVTDGECRVLRLSGALKQEFGGSPILGEDVVVLLGKARGRPGRR